MGLDGPGLSCPGSSVVIDHSVHLLIKSPVEIIPQDIQQEESSPKGEDS
jgi:hypothetical protein